MSIYSRITGTGSYLPKKILTNHDLEQIVDTSDEWIRGRTGICERRIAADDEFTLDLAEQAALRAIQASGIKPEDIGLIVVATTTADQIFPSTASLLQSRLKIKGCPAFDIQAVCTGFIYALGVAEKFIRTETCKSALVVGAETFSRIVDWEDRDTCVLFGDGAGAVVLEASYDAGILSTHMHCDGDYADYLHVPQGVSTNHAAVVEGRAFVEMKGSSVFKMAVKTLGRIADETLNHNNLDKHELNWLVPHQANTRIIEATAKKLDLPMDRVIVTVDKQGNTSAASIPLALDTAVRDNRIKRGDLILLEGFGGGFTWGSALVRY